MKRNVEKIDPTKPLYYIALVLKGTEQQYLDLLSYIEKRNRAQIIYQCKSLTYLYITQENPQTLKMASSAASPKISHDKGLRRGTP
ncbi:MAG: hypothetical protein RMJ15_01975 [Nitrososphaerota archaeon]|nr:hypothetical protein [Candidatus Bathyarchaeota archaeon]MDW8022501.1 hypothetical protein [Nitrososphaerota archaeon]